MEWRRHRAKSTTERARLCLMDEPSNGSVRSRTSENIWHHQRRPVCVSFSDVRKTQNTSISSNKNGSLSFWCLVSMSILSVAVLVESSCSKLSFFDSTEEETSFLQNLPKLFFLVRCHLMYVEYSSTTIVREQQWFVGYTNASHQYSSIVVQCQDLFGY